MKKFTPSNTQTYAYITEAPPPATIVHILPFLLRIVSFRDAPLLASNSAIYASCETNESMKKV